MRCILGFWSVHWPRGSPNMPLGWGIPWPWLWILYWDFSQSWYAMKKLSLDILLDISINHVPSASMILILVPLPTSPSIPRTLKQQFRKVSIVWTCLNYRLSMIINDYQWLSMMINDYQWLSLVVLSFFFSFFFADCGVGVRCGAMRRFTSEPHAALRWPQVPSIQK